MYWVATARCPPPLDTFVLGYYADLDRYVVVRREVFFYTDDLWRRQQTPDKWAFIHPANEL